MIHRQSSHGKHVAMHSYAIDATCLRSLNPRLIRAFENASFAWHRLFLTQENQPIGRKHSREQSKQIARKRERAGTTEKHRESPRINRASLALQRLGGATARYRSGIHYYYYSMLIYYYRSEDQRQAMEFLHNDAPHLSIVVLPTSAGKSWLFYSAAALVDQQTVVVVVPFRELLKTTLQDALKFGLSCQEWTNQESCKELSQLTIVSADKVCNDLFRHYLSNLDENGYLAHIFIDECHTALLDTSYRPSLRELYTIHYMRSCRITYLTATLMPLLAPIFQLALGFYKCSTFRRPTARPTIGYRVYDKGSGKLIPSTIGYIREHCLLDGKSGIIFVPSYAIGQELRSELGCLFYVASDTEEEKDRILGSWIESKGWIIATTALGQGLNFSGILHVVHCGRPYTLSGALQQGGRGGRGGEISYHTIIEDVAHTSPMKKEVISKGSPKDIEETGLTAFIQAPECRRVVLAYYMDGDLGRSTTDCRSLDYVLCDWCESQARHELISREHRKRAQRSMELEELSIDSRRVENRVENRGLRDFALRVEAPHSSEFNALGMRASHESYAPGSHRSHTPGSHRSHTPGSHRSHAPGIQESHTPGIQESHAPGMHAPGMHAPGMHAPGMHAPGMHAPRIQESHALGSHRSHAPGSHESHALGSHISRAPSTNAFETPLSGAPSTERSQVISQRLSNIEQANDLLIKIMNRLRGECYYCLCSALENGANFKVSKEHSWRSCIARQSDRRLGSIAFETFKKRLVFNKDQCRECGLPLSICRRLDRSTEGCDYKDILIPVLFIIEKGSSNWLRAKVKRLGFEGDFNKLKEWWAQEEVCFGKQWETNYMRIFRAICNDIYRIWGW
jgi:superfamily II DNA helicase RecQ